MAGKRTIGLLSAAVVTFLVAVAIGDYGLGAYHQYKRTHSLACNPEHLPAQATDDRHPQDERRVQFSRQIIDPTTGRAHRPKAIADMTGDGLQDIVFLNDGHVDYWPYLGNGKWGRRITMAGSVQFPDAPVYGGVGFDPKRALLGDVDGDGLADLVYIESGRVTIWLNQSGNGWNDPIVVHGTPPVTDVDAVRLADTTPLSPGLRVTPMSANRVDRVTFLTDSSRAAEVTAAITTAVSRPASAW